MRAPYYQDAAVTLYHGDCREIMPELPSKSFDFAFTDPVYGHNNNNGDLIHRWESALGRLPIGATPPQGRPLQNDGKEAEELFRFAVAEFNRLLIGGGCCCCCCCGGGGPDPMFARWSLFIDEVMDFKQMVVWDKGPIGMGWHYRRSYETVLVGQVRGKKCRWFDDSHKIENIIRPNYKGIKKIIPSAAQHPTEKPVALSSHFIGLHTLPGHSIIDPFCGAGTTGVSAKRMGRKAVLIELEEQFCEMAAKRLQAEVVK